MLSQKNSVPVATMSAWYVAITGAMLAAAPTAAEAAFTLPSGLNPGDHYRLVFVTSGTTVATSTDITTYDSFVTAQAALEATLPSTTWSAIGSTSAVAASAHISCGVTCDAYPIFLVTGAPVATSLADLLDGSIITPINRTQAGNPLDLTYVWTGSDPFGGKFAGDELGGISGFTMAGYTSSSGNEWMRLGSYRSDSTSLPLYAISGDLTVPGAAGVPEPSSLALFGAAGAALAALRRRRRAGRA